MTYSDEARSYGRAHAAKFSRWLAGRRRCSPGAETGVRERCLALLATAQQPLTVRELTTASGYTKKAIRKHLAVLVANGQVLKCAVAGSKFRPAATAAYQYNPVDESVFAAPPGD